MNWYKKQTPHGREEIEPEIIEKSMNSTSGLFRLNINDFVKGLISAVVAGVIFAIGSSVSQTGFDLFKANWHIILNTAFQAGFAALVGYLGKNFLTNNDRRETFAGMIPTK